MGVNIIMKECFSNTHSNTYWPHLTAPFYSICVETSICHFNSFKCSPVMHDEVREHLTRDQRPFLHPESLQIFRFTASSLQFTSLIFYRIQIREHLTRDQRPFHHPESLQIFRFTASSLQFTSLIFYRVQIREHLTRDQRPFLHPESLQIFRFTASSLQFTSLMFYRVQIREHLTRDQRPFLHPESLQIFRFTASSLQFTSLIFYRVQVREHLTRDQRPFLHPESLQIFRFTASSLQFTHLLQGSGQRTPDTRSETIPSSRITPDPLDSHLLFSSPHSSSTGFRSEDWNGHSRSLVLCSVTHFCVVFEVCVWIIVQLEDPNMAHYKISNRVSHLLIFLSVGIW